MLSIGTSRKWNLTARSFQDRTTTSVAPPVRLLVLRLTRTAATTPTTPTTTLVVPIPTTTIPDPTGITTPGRIMVVRRIILRILKTFPVNLASTENSPRRRSNVG